MSKQRKIPTIMCSQHPDHAQVPFWSDAAYIQTHDEIHETYVMFNNLAVDEVMWDWEGKLVDESVIEKLLMKYSGFFADHPLGVDRFLTFRVPNPRVEPGYRLARAFMVMLSAHLTAKEASLANPLFEAIVPMVQSEDDLTQIYSSYVNVSSTIQSEFGHNTYSKQPLELIPIFESVDDILNSNQTIRRYVGWLQENYGVTPDYFRPFCARSDPAMNAGIIPTTLAIKWALHQYTELETELGIKMHPIIAPGSLLFRGGLRPDTVDSFMNEYAGIKTVVIQSAFRYDFPTEDVERAIAKLKTLISNSVAKPLGENDKVVIDRLIAVFSQYYRQTVTELIPLIQQTALFVPRRRDRMQHIGLFGYSRQVGSSSLPRAIGFTCAGYSMGIPPELWGLGQGLAELSTSDLHALNELYPTLRTSLQQVAGYFRSESLKELGISGLFEHLPVIEKFIEQPLGPTTDKHHAHTHLVQTIIAKMRAKEDATVEVEAAAKLRKSIG
jgi:phosphoenolpyruvate carboxylase